MILTLALVLLTELLNTLGQVFFKKATNGLNLSTGGQESYRKFIGRVIRRPEIGLGIGCMTLGLLTWLSALSTADLSVVFPLGSLQYILILLASRLILSEKIDVLRWIGTLLIAFGIAFIVAS